MIGCPTNRLHRFEHQCSQEGRTIDSNRDLEGPTTGERSYRSGPTETNDDFRTVHNNGDVPPALGELEHFLEGAAVLFYVLVLDRIVSLGVVLTGRRRVGSGILAENHNLVRHFVSRL